MRFLPRFYLPLRLKNEITRLTTVKALIVVTQSPLRINLDPILNTDFMPVLAG